MIKKIMIYITLTCSLLAHDIWIDDSFAINYGHIDKESSHGDEKVIAKESILRVSCSRDAKISESKNKELKSGCDAIFVELKKAYYTKTPYGTKKQSKDKTKMPMSSFQSIESVKRIYSDDAKELFKSGLELTLRNRLSEINVDDKARLLVTFDDKAKAGVSVAYGDRVIGVSDENGHINIRIRKSGLQNIKASYTLKGDGIKCDEIIYSTTLNIEVLK
jgi:nickel transport protein